MTPPKVSDFEQRDHPPGKVVVRYSRYGASIELEVDEKHQFAVLDEIGRGSPRTDADGRWPAAQALHADLLAKQAKARAA